MPATVDNPARRRLRTLLDVPEAQRRPMTKDESSLFVQICMLQAAEQDEVLTASDLRSRIVADNAPFGVQLLALRLGLGGDALRFSYPTVCFLASISRNAAGAVMWANYLVHRTRQIGKPITTAELADDFPFGFPGDEGCLSVWDAQKVRPGDPASPTDNCLDAAWAWQAFDDRVEAA